MDWLQHSVIIAGSSFLIIDVVALFWFIFAWLGYARYATLHYHKRLNLIRIMDDMRSRWMHQVMHREVRIADATLIGNILHTIYFFASTSILVLIGLFTLLGSQTQGVQMIHSIPFAADSTPLTFEIKTSLLILIFIYTFFKLTWSLRLYNYACIVVGAAPMPHDTHVNRQDYAKRAGKLISNAGRHFNMGLRAYYFGMAVLGWYFNSPLFMAMTALVVYVVYRREFRSHAVNELIAIDPK